MSIYGDVTVGHDLFIGIETLHTGFVSMEEIKTMPSLCVISKSKLSINPEVDLSRQGVC